MNNMIRKVYDYRTCLHGIDVLCDALSLIESLKRKVVLFISQLGGSDIIGYWFVLRAILVSLFT